MKNSGSDGMILLTTWKLERPQTPNWLSCLLVSRWLINAWTGTEVIIWLLESTAFGDAKANSAKLYMKLVAKNGGSVNCTPDHFHPCNDILSDLNTLWLRDHRSQYRKRILGTYQRTPWVSWGQRRLSTLASSHVWANSIFNQIHKTGWHAFHSVRWWIKGIVQLKKENSFQTCLTYFLLWDIKGNFFFKTSLPLFSI